MCQHPGAEAGSAAAGGDPVDIPEACVDLLGFAAGDLRLYDLPAGMGEPIQKEYHHPVLHQGRLGKSVQRPLLLRAGWTGDSGQ